MTKIPGAKMVVAAVQPEMEPLNTARALEDLKTEARKHQSGSETSVDYVFTHIDADRYSDWVEGFDKVPEVRPTFFVFDTGGDAYYINSESLPIGEFLDGVSAGSVEAHSYKKSGSAKAGFSKVIKVSSFARWILG